MRKQNPIRAVTFDVGGTLIEPWPSVGHVYAQVAAEHGEPAIDPELLNRQFAAAWKGRKGFDYSRASWSKIVSQTFFGSAMDLPELKYFGELYERFARSSAWRMYDDVVPALEALVSRGVRLAVISNWDERLRPLLRELHLDGYFDFVAVSGEIGFHKPSPVIFQEAIRKLGCPADAILHVGDSDEEDVKGAIGAGMHGLRVNRGATERERGEGTIAALTEVEGRVG